MRSGHTTGGESALDAVQLQFVQRSIQPRLQRRAVAENYVDVRYDGTATQSEMRTIEAGRRATVRIRGRVRFLQNAVAPWLLPRRDQRMRTRQL